ncbi:MAG: alpha/beta fold hydrolase [Candidatus Dormibacteraeota bacterium]|nr:alpha/beta fold hydrolase [Candidatus Dormibacteraeota bacterium]
MRVRSGDLEVAVHEWGSGPPVLVLHGLGDDHRALRRLVPELSLRHRVIAPDLRGHGGTSLGHPEGTLAQLATDVVTLLDTLGLDQVDLVGFSLGGTIALQVALQAPERVGRLVGVATSSRVGRRALAWYEDRARVADSGVAALRTALAEDMGTLFLPGSPLMSDHLRLREEATADPRGFANACRANLALGEAPLDSALPRITSPALLIAARQDPLCPPRAAEIVAAGIPGARLEVVDGTGHEIPVERPEALARHLLDFLDAR